MTVKRLFVSSLLALAAALAQPLRLPAAVVEMRVDYARSTFVALTHGDSFFGVPIPEHAILPTDWTMTLCLDPERFIGEGFVSDIEIPTKALRLDSAAACKAAGIPVPQDTAESARLQSRLLGPEVLDAEHHPLIRYKVTSAVQNPTSNPAVIGLLTLGAMTAPLTVAVEYTPGKDGQVHIVTSFSLRQSDFGLRPEVINLTTPVSDLLNVNVDLWAASTGKSCPRASTPAKTGKPTKAGKRAKAAKPAKPPQLR